MPRGVVIGVLDGDEAEYAGACRSSPSHLKSARCASTHRRRVKERGTGVRRRPTSGVAAAPAAGNRRASGDRPGRATTSETPVAPGTNAWSMARHRPGFRLANILKQRRAQTLHELRGNDVETSVLRPIHSRR